MAHKVYLDYSATTPCDEIVLNEMIPYFTTKFGNPNSIHEFGNEALDALNTARSHVAKLINSEFNEIVFTSGATESNKIAIERTVNFIKGDFITAPTEHKSVLDLAGKSFLKLNSEGVIDLEYLDNLLDGNPTLVSICMVNNETGTLQDIAKIAQICHSKKALIHTDATQAFGKIPIDVKELDVDFLSASGHKIYGPKGVGILFYKTINRKYIRVDNANHEVEFGIQAGTVPVPLCVGMGKATEIANETLMDNLTKITKLRKMLLDGVSSQLEEIYINGSSESNYPGIVNISFRGCEGEALMMECSRIAVSSGSACTSNKLSISHVLKAMGIPADIAQSSLRITIGKNTTAAEIEIAIEDLVNATLKLRKFSPIWDMIKMGIDVNSVFQGGNSHAI
ncbi:MAG: cysteine desulfurase [Holosporales bacterium]|jgi:cysteine desulfurase|nr:cysteine desulfurase [Holosporales bacterium]